MQPPHCATTLEIILLKRCSMLQQNMHYWNEHAVCGGGGCSPPKLLLYIGSGLVEFFTLIVRLLR